MTTAQFTNWLHSELDAVYNNDTTPGQVMLKAIPMLFEVQKALQQTPCSALRELLLEMLRKEQVALMQNIGDDVEDIAAQNIKSIQIVLRLIAAQKPVA